MSHTSGDESDDISDPRRWRKGGWIAQVIKNENDEGWAVAMTRVGDSEPALVSPWTMGRDKVNPKPLDHSGFATLVKGATEVMRRAELAQQSRMRRTLTCAGADGQRWRAELVVQPDEDDPHAILSVFDEATGERLRSGRTSPAFKLAAASVQQFVRAGD